MRTIWFVAIVVCVVTSSVHAQPGETPPVPPQQQPAPLPAPEEQQPPPSPNPPPNLAIQLTPDEQALLAKGEIPRGRYRGGAVTSIFVGYGVGAGIQGRWRDTGWIFTFAEIPPAIGLGIALLRSLQACTLSDEEGCRQSTRTPLFVGSLIAFAALRIVEIYDAFSGPPRHNRRVRELRMRTGAPQPLYTRLVPYVDKPKHGNGSGGVVGLSLSF